MDIDLTGKNIGFVMANGFTEDHYTQPMAALRKAGANVYVIGHEGGTVMAWHDAAWGHSFMVDVQAIEANPEAFDLVVVPGGVEHVKVIRNNEHCVAFVKDVVQAGGAMAALGTGVALLAVAGVAAGRTVAAEESVRDELVKAGATIAEGPKAMDGRLATLADDEHLQDFLQDIAALADGRAEEQKNAA